MRSITLAQPIEFQVGDRETTTSYICTVTVKCINMGINPLLSKTSIVTATLASNHWGILTQTSTKFQCIIAMFGIVACVPVPSLRSSVESIR